MDPGVAPGAEVQASGGVVNATIPVLGPTVVAVHAGVAVQGAADRLVILVVQASRLAPEPTADRGPEGGEVGLLPLELPAGALQGSAPQRPAALHDLGPM